MDRDQFAEWYCKKRDCAKSSGVTSYYSLKKIRKALSLDEKIPKGYSWINKRVYTYLKNVEKLVTRKNLSIAIVAYLKALKAPKKKVQEATDFMNKYAKELDQIYRNQTKTKKQESEWVNAKSIRNFLKEKTAEVQAKNIFDKETLTKSDKKLVMEYLILVLHSHNPPRLEFAELVFTNNPKKDGATNWLYYRKKKGWFALVQTYKTSRKKGPNVIKFGNAVSRVLNKLRRRFTEGKPVFTDKHGKMMSRNNYGKHITKIMSDRFGKKVSASMLRTIFLTDLYSGLKPLKEMEKTASDMGHSLATALSRYVKQN